MGNFFNLAPPKKKAWDDPGYLAPEGYALPEAPPELSPALPMPDEMDAVEFVYAESVV